ncbi:hypothetical protein B4064_2790 [Caldibacillus thermoamylovorans]|uniref:Uncharacterized protein n=1 Tax=Caldibacillus thermoamylovorans TaxID=35841 RepID=A0A0D0EIX9_9BACI|nr:hypothetical protein B4064_2790 [Caldibacillus thermoamylovorans]KIO68846.1 hypothetical protein B4166_2011 [Caldibacillus thermoamylovorans]KIO69047.1 hypothetical protein B4065_1540 [Caldibacillus thermoamylovorans]KIO74016.1 hypothetical protein B4167_1641 [Caldibacillus thermoamylovorans]
MDFHTTYKASIPILLNRKFSNNEGLTKLHYLKIGFETNGDLLKFPVN